MNVSELTLPDLDITNPAFAENPFPQYREAIKQHWLASTAVGYVVLGFNDMKNLLLMDDKLDTPNKAITTLMGADDSIWGKWNNRFMLAISGDDHKRIRDLVAPTFTPRNAELHRPIMKETVNGLLDDWAARNRFDFAEFASFFPISVMCRLIGAPVEWRPRKDIEARQRMPISLRKRPARIPKTKTVVARHCAGGNNYGIRRKRLDVFRIDKSAELYLHAEPEQFGLEPGRNIADCARARWKIENETFNVLKQHGYHLKHNFGHGNDTLAGVLVVLNLLAFSLHSARELAETLWQSARRRLGTRRRLFEHLRTVTEYRVFPDWNNLLSLLATGGTAAQPL